MRTLVDAFPVPVIFLFIVTTTWLAIEAGYRIGRKQVVRGSAVAGSRRKIANLALVLAFALVAILIVDLDRPGSGVSTTNQQAMLHLQESMTE